MYSQCGLDFAQWCCRPPDKSSDGTGVSKWNVSLRNIAPSVSCAMGQSAYSQRSLYLILLNILCRGKASK